MKSTSRFPVVMVLLLLCGLMLMGETSARELAEACPLFCLQVDYMTCATSGDQRLKGSCNCCLAPKNCTLHLTNGNNIYCN
ncbi:uncharacterized protein LOC131164632 [Malania oleifera]|uniref:uncharacterized protein LOC131164632 n=1 Tax=Malania oleifera TaxID=397392 RepID=UPI0025AE1409|nr:uncharacterized protein LOC131164632 [Malania oleifera]